jgi:hypothetical protein
VSALEDAANELYGLIPAEFVTARNRLAAGSSGDLAADIRALVKPAAAPWAINLLARGAPDRLGELVELGSALRDAQAALDRDALRELTGKRRKLVASLAREAEVLAKDSGSKLSAAAMHDIEETLQAALADADAGSAVRSGRLVRSLSSTGIDSVDLDGAVAGSGSAAAAGSSGSRAMSGRARGGRVDKLERDRAAARSEAERALATAEKTARSLAKLKSARGSADKALASATAEVDRITALLAAAKKHSDEVGRDARSIAQDLAAAERADAAARSAAEKASQRLNDLG